MKDERHTGVGDGLMKAQWLMCCMPHTTLHSTPSPFLLCVLWWWCMWCGGWHSPTHCPAVLHPLCSSLSVPLSSTTITLKSTQGVVERREGERNGWGKREEEEEERCGAKTCGKKGAKREKEITTPGVPRLSPTLVLTRPKQA